MTDPDLRRPSAPHPERPLPRGRDAMRAPEVDREPTADSGAGTFYLVAGVMIAFVLAMGLLFYNPGTPGDRPGDRNDQARQPERPPITTR